MAEPNRTEAPSEAAAPAVAPVAPPRRKRPRSRNVLGLLMAAAILLAGITIGIVRSPPFQDFLRDRIEAEATLQLERTVRIGSLRLTLMPPRVVLERVSIANAEELGERAPFFEAEQIDVTTGWHPLRENGLRLRSVRLERPRLILEQLPDGSWNYPIPRRQPTDASGEGVIHLDRLQFRNGALAVGGSEFPLEFDIDDIAGEWLRPGPEETRWLTLRTRQLGVDRQGEHATAVVAVAAKLARDRIEIDHLDIDSAIADVRASGVIALGARRNRGRLAIAGSVDLAPLDALFGRPAKARGRVDLDGDVNFEADGARLTGEVRSAAVELGRHRLTDLGAHVDVTARGATVDLDHVSALGGRLAGKIVFTIDADADVQLVGDDLSGAELVAWLLPQVPTIDSRIDLKADVRVPRRQWEQAVGSARLELRPEGGNGLALAGKAEIELLPSSLTIRSLALEMPSFRLNADGNVGRASGDGRLTFHTEIRDADAAQKLFWSILPLPATFRAFFPQLAGRADARGTLLSRAGFEDFELDFDAHASPFAVDGHELQSLAAHFVIGPTGLKIPFGRATTAEGGFIEAAGTVLDWQLDQGPRFDLDATAERFPARAVLDAVALEWLDVDGLASGRFVLRGWVDELDGGGPLQLDAANFWDQPARRVTGQVVLDDGNVRLEGVHGEIGAHGDVRGWARFDVADERFAFDADVGDVVLADLTSVGPNLPKGFGAEATGHAEGHGDYVRPSIAMRGGLRQVMALDRRLTSESLPFSAELEDRQFDVHLLGPSGLEATFHTTIDVGAGIEGRWSLTAPDLSPFADFLYVERFADRIGGQLAAAGVFDVDDAGAWVANGDIDQLEWRTGEHDLKLVAPAAIEFTPRALHLDRLALAGSAGEATVDGLVSFGAETTVLATLEGRLQLQALDAFVPLDLELDGRLGFNLEAEGAIGRPDFRGRVTVDGGRLHSPSFAAAGLEESISDIRAAIVLAGPRATIERLDGRYGDRGRLGLSGSMTMAALLPERFRLRLLLDHLPYHLYGFDFDGGGEVVVSGDLERLRVRGEITLAQALYSEDFRIRLDEFVAAAPEALARASIEPWMDRIELELRLLAPGTVAIENNVASVKGDAELFLRGTLAHPSLLGQVLIAEGGEVELQDVLYQVTDGTVFFSNPLKVEPYFDVRAEADVGSYLVRLSVTGTLERFTPTFSSDPPLSQEEIVYLLLTGSTTPDGGLLAGSGSLDQRLTEATQATLTQLMLESVNRRGKELLRLDRFTIDPLVSEENQFGAGVTVGKKLSKNLSLTYVYRPGEATGSEDRERLLVEYRLGRNLFLQGTRDEHGLIAFDVKYRTRY